MPKRKRSKKKTLTHKNAQVQRQLEKTVQESKEALKRLAQVVDHA